MWRAATVILRKDLRLRIRDRSVLLFAFVVPIGLTLLFSLVYPDTEELRLTAAVVDDDRSEVSRGFTDGVVPALIDEGVLDLVEASDVDAAREAVAEGEIDAAWIVPDGFGGDIRSGADTAIEVLVTEGGDLQSEIAVGVAQAYGSQLEGISLAVATVAGATGAMPDDAAIAAAAEAAGEQPAAVALERLDSGAVGQLDPLSYLAAGIAAFFVFFVVQYGITGLLEEEQLDTMPRLRAAPIPPAAVQVGKLLGAFLLGLLSMTSLSIASSLLLDAAWGPPLGVAVLIVALVIAAMGVMALVASFARTAEQASNYQSIVAVVLGLFGGVFFPLPGDGGLLRIAMAVSPHGWFLRGLSELASSGDSAVVIGPASAIVAFGVVAAIPAFVLQRRARTW